MRPLFLLLAACCSTVRAAGQLGSDRLYAEQIATRSAAEYGVPVAMVRAVIRVESGWHPDALSNKGAMGMMQLMPDTARVFHVNHPFWIDPNIRAGTAYLAILFRHFRDWRLALAAYNAGPAVIEKRGLQYSSPVVHAYVTRVLAVYRWELKRGSLP